MWGEFDCLRVQIQIWSTVKIRREARTLFEMDSNVIVIIDKLMDQGIWRNVTSRSPDTGKGGNEPVIEGMNEK